MRRRFLRTLLMHREIFNLNINLNYALIEISLLNDVHLSLSIAICP